MIKNYLKSIVFPIIFMGLGLVLSFPKDKLSIDKDISFIIALTAIFIVCGIILAKYKPRVDIYLLSFTLFFVSVGSMMILRLKPELYGHQLLWIIIGLIAAMGIVFFTDRLLALLDYPYILGLIALLLLVAVLLIGTDINGNRNWIILGPIQFQPSEFAKIFIIAFLAAFLAENKNVLTLPNKSFKFFYLPPFRFLAPLLTIWGISLLMFVVLRDLGSALLFFGIVIIMTYVATGKKTYVILASAFFAISAYISYFLFHHVQVRVAIWLHPWQDPMGAAYQIVQSLFAFSYGGFWGTGFQHGYPNLIPEVHTDFIFAALGEEFGLLGVTLLLLAYLLLFSRGVKIALQCSNEKYKLLAFGLSMTLLLQTFIILGGVTKLLPLTGITLPLISYGGSSIVSSFISVGLLMALSQKEGQYE